MCATTIYKKDVHINLQLKWQYLQGNIETNKIDYVFFIFLDENFPRSDILYLDIVHLYSEI